MNAIESNRTPVQIDEAVSSAEFGDLIGGLVVARNDVSPAGFGPQNFAGGGHVFAHIHEVAGAEVSVGFDRHQAAESGKVAVNVGVEENLH